MRILKKRNILIVAQGLLISLLMSTSLVLAQGNTATVIANQGILRASGDFEGEIIQTVSIGTQVSIQNVNNEWYQVMLQDRALEGWMYKDILIEDNENIVSSKKGIITVEGVLNLRSMPSTEGSSILSKLANGTEVAILMVNGDWLQVQLSNGIEGFVHADYVHVLPNYPQAKVLVDYSNIHEDPNSHSNITVVLSKNNDIYIKKYDNGWYNILTNDFIEGWIKSEEVELKINVLQPVNRSGSRTHVLSNIKAVSEKYLGKPYKYATSGPNTFDCSGFTFYIFDTYYKDYLKQKGINLPRSSRDQANVGTRINRDQLQVGDLVFFNNGSSATISHVGIYIGNNEFIHASSTPGDAKIKISPLNTGHYNRRYSTAVRL